MKFEVEPHLEFDLKAMALCVYTKLHPKYSQ